MVYVCEGSEVSAFIFMLTAILFSIPYTPSEKELTSESDSASWELLQGIAYFVDKREQCSISNISKISKNLEMDCHPSAEEYHFLQKARSSRANDLHA